ncbi:PREDICTED: putative nuclease HARBI1 [Papilio polytes]|uniref:putative nuclease HARBI1 n=1 Tax=Papilio polytes TaxID=76194 RepID=UPI0006769027|nr:PREDICTED: putative nuclease HARBI1 [Papilio polytes]
MSRMWNAFMLLEAADAEAKKINRQRMLLNRVRNRERLLQKIPEWQFRTHYRLNKEEFHSLCDELRRNTRLKGSKTTSLELKVLTALSFYAMGSYQKGIANEVHMDQRSVSQCIREVTKALNVLSNKWVQFPQTSTQRTKIKQGFYSKFNFPGVIGAIDCTHVAIVRPAANEPCFYNRKGFHSLNIQMVCDSDLRITNVNAKFGGASHDSHIWESSRLRNHMESLQRSGESVWLLGDSGYPQRSYLMTPILNAEPGSRGDKYTKVHIKARNCIERAFGVLKSRFRCLLGQRVLYYHPDYAAEIVIACVVLHNMLLDSRGIPTDQDAEVILSTDPIQPTVVENGLDVIAGRAVRDRLINSSF